MGHPGWLLNIPNPVINSYSFSNGEGGVFSEPWNVGEKVNYRCEEQFHKKEDWKLVPDPASPAVPNPINT